MNGKSDFRLALSMSMWFKLKYLLLAHVFLLHHTIGYASQSMSHTISIIGCLFLILLTTSCGDKASSSKAPPLVEASVGQIDPKAEEKAIVALLDKETRFFANKDADGVLSCYVSDGRFSRIQQLPGGAGMVKTGGKLEDMRGPLMAYLINLDEDVFELQDRIGLKISYSDDNTVGTVTFTQIAESGGLRTKSEEIRTVEKIDGEWKILLISSVMY